MDMLIMLTKVNGMTEDDCRNEWGVSQRSLVRIFRKLAVQQIQEEEANEAGNREQPVKTDKRTYTKKPKVEQPALG